MPKLRETFGKNLKAIRSKMDISQTEFAAIIGVSSHTNVLAYEKAKMSPGLDQVEKIAERLGVNPLELLSETPVSISMPLDPKKMALISFILTAEDKQLAGVYAAASAFTESEESAASSG